MGSFPETTWAPMSEGLSQAAEKGEPVGLAAQEPPSASPKKLEEETDSLSNPEASLNSGLGENISAPQARQAAGDNLRVQEAAGAQATQPAQTSVPVSVPVGSQDAPPESSLEATASDPIFSFQEAAGREDFAAALESAKEVFPLSEESKRSERELPEPKAPVTPSASKHEKAPFFQQATEPESSFASQIVPPEKRWDSLSEERGSLDHALCVPSVLAEREAASGAENDLGRPEPASSPGSSSSALEGMEASLERALWQWQAEAARYFEELSRTRAKVQRFSGAAKLAEIHSSWEAIHRAGQEYLTTARPVREAFEQFSNLRSGIKPIRDHLNTSAMKEEALIELTPELMPGADEQYDTHLLCQQLLQHTDRLLEANRKVQTALDKARRGGEHQRLGPELSELCQPRTGFLPEGPIWEKVITWWREQRVGTHRLSVILLEVDDFGQIQEEFGPSISEGLLRAIENLLAIAHEEEGFLVPLAGPRFAQFCGNHSLDQAVTVAEHLRQAIMATRFYRKRTELRISVSCGVTEATGDDTPETVLERAEVALLQARRYGKGRCFSHDGYFPIPVPAHPLGVSPKEIEI